MYNVCDLPKPIREGGRPSETGGLEWAVYPQMSDFLLSCVIAEHWPTYYGGPGCQFAHRANVRKFRDGRILITQFYGLDI